MFSLHIFKYSWTSGSSPGELEVAALMDFFPLRHRVLLTVPVPEPLASDLAEPLWQRTFPGRLLARLPDGTRYGPIPARLRGTIQQTGTQTLFRLGPQAVFGRSALPKLPQQGSRHLGGNHQVHHSPSLEHGGLKAQQKDFFRGWHQLLHVFQVLPLLESDFQR